MTARLPPRVSPAQAGIVYAGFTLSFALLLRALLPWLREGLGLHPALCWFLTGYALFVPMVALTVVLVRREGARSWSQMAHALRIRPLGRTGWLTAVGLTVLVSALTWALMRGAELLGAGPITATPSFLAFEPLRGTELFLLVVWAGMFAFNILGEELLWRGYLQTRMPGRAAWIWGSLFWAGFHIPFGTDLLILLVPVFLVLPYAVSRTENTSVGIALHALYNGPAFVLVALGIVR